uniref:Secreted protein n=1 Tax=Heterorhabditis bacteriophora TaxID=37862 RepID=A0A1I7XKU7_HETBA
MWRAVLAATLLCVATQPAVFTEGGSVDGETIFQSEYDYPKHKDIYSDEEIAEVEDKIKVGYEWYAKERQEDERESSDADKYNKQMIDILKVLEKQRTDETGA